MHGVDIAERAAELLRRQLQRKGVPGLQQDALRLHQTLPHGAVGRLAEVPALGVLQVRPACGKGDLHIGQGRARQHAEMLFVHQAGEDQPLPVPVQRVLAAYRVVNHAASRWQR